MHLSGITTIQQQQHRLVHEHSHMAQDIQAKWLARGVRRLEDPGTSRHLHSMCVIIAFPSTILPPELGQEREWSMIPTTSRHLHSMGVIIAFPSTILPPGLGEEGEWSMIRTTSSPGDEIVDIVAW
jgi:hypothetical protein